MADNPYENKKNPEIKPEAPEPAPGYKPESKEIKEAKISVEVEAGEIIEDSEMTSGEVSETEKTTKEGYSGGASGATTAGVNSKARFKYPSTSKMTKQIESEVKKEMKQLNKKIKKIVKMRDANTLNNLVARLRELQRILSKLANATSELIKDLWIEYVKEKK